MAIKHLSSIDLTGLEVYGLRPEHVPFSQFGLLTTYTGRIVYDSTNHRVKFYNGAEWLDMSGDIREITVGVGLTGGGTADTVNVSIASTIAGNGLTWNGTDGILNVGASDGIEVTGDNVRLKNSPNLTEGTLLYWDDLNAQLQNSRVSQVAQVTQSGTEYTVTINAEQTVMTGSLTVQGVLTSINSNEVNIGDAIIKLNFDEAGAPSQNAGFEVQRGTSSNVSFLWDETNDRFTTVDQPLHVGSVATITPGTADFFYMYDNTLGETGEIKKATYNSVADLLGTPKHFSLDTAQTGVVTKSGNVYTVTHNFGTKAVTAQVISYDTYETVMVDVTRPTVNTVTVSFATAVTDNDYFVVLVPSRRSGDVVAGANDGEAPDTANA